MFALLGIALGAGIAAGLAARGRFANLREITFRGAPVLFVSLLVGMIPLAISLPHAARQTFQVVSLLGVLAFLALNIVPARGALRAGLGVVLAGWALNFIVVASNGGMPLGRWAWARSGQSGAPTPGQGGFFKIVLAHPGTHVRFLGDMIPVRFVMQVVSIGDILLIVGIAVVIATGMRARASAAEPVRPLAA